MVYAVVHKVRRKGRVVRVSVRVGTEEQLCAALHCSSVSEHVNIAYVERYNATDRHLNSRKARKVYSFSKHPLFHEAATYFTQGIYNFCRHNRGLTIKTCSHSRTRLTRRAPAMASGETAVLGLNPVCGRGTAILAVIPRARCPCQCACERAWSER